jgi:predicted transcriptional regulator
MDIQRLTQAEEEVMQYIWRLGRCTVSRILDEMGEPRPPHSSVSTIVRILERKGFVSHNAYGRTHEYFATVSKDNYSRSRLRAFIESYFDDSPSALVSFLVRKDETSVDELEQLIQELKKKKRI